MKYVLLTFLALSVSLTAQAQFSAVSTNLTGWATGSINAAVDVSVNRHNTINIPISVNPFRFGDTQWRHIAVQPGWRHWFVERYIGHFVSPSLFYANYELGHGKSYYMGNAYGVGLSWGYSKLLSTRWNFVVEIGIGIIYTPYTEQYYPKYHDMYDDEWSYHHRRIMLLPTKCNLSFSYLF